MAARSSERSTRAGHPVVDYAATVTTPSLDDLFDFSKLRRSREPEPEPEAAPEPAPRRRRIRDREALRSMRPLGATPIDSTDSFHAARSAVRQRTSEALESLGVEADAPAAVTAPAVVADVPSVPQWRVLVRSAGRALVFFVAGRDVFDAVSRGTPAVARWMRENEAGAPWRVEAVEDLSGSLLI